MAPAALVVAFGRIGLVSEVGMNGHLRRRLGYHDSTDLQPKRFLGEHHHPLVRGVEETVGYHGLHSIRLAGAEREHRETTRWFVGSFHYGTFGGPLTEAIWITGCLVVVILTASGFFLRGSKVLRRKNGSYAANPGPDKSVSHDLVRRRPREANVVGMRRAGSRLAQPGAERAGSLRKSQPRSTPNE